MKNLFRHCGGSCARQNSGRCRCQHELKVKNKLSRMDNGRNARSPREEFELMEHQVTSFKGVRRNVSLRKEQKEADDVRPRVARRPQPTTTSALHTNQNGNRKKKRNCIFCNRSHEEADCEKVKTVEERQNLIFKQGCCLVCSTKGHRAFQCHTKVLCLECKCNHNVYI